MLPKMEIYLYGKDPELVKVAFLGEVVMGDETN